MFRPTAMITKVRIVTASWGLENWSQNSHEWFAGRLVQYQGYGITTASATSTGMKRLGRSGIRCQASEIASLARPICAQPRGETFAREPGSATTPPREFVP